MNQYAIDIHKPKAFESFFPDTITKFHTAINFTKNEEEVFQLIAMLAEDCGFCGIVYEYCPDAFADDPDHFMRTSLPISFVALEKLAKKRAKQGYGRAHTVEKWTPLIGGAEFSELFKDYPNQIWKFRLSTLMTGLRSGFAIPLRSPNPATRAGFGFISKMRRNEFEEKIAEHGWPLHSAAWAAHIRILQHATQKAVKPTLTARQLEYLHHLATGSLDKQIAYDLGISHSAVRKHQYAVTKRLGVTRRIDIIPKAIECGIIESASLEMTPEAKWDLKLA